MSYKLQHRIKYEIKSFTRARIQRFYDKHITQRLLENDVKVGAPNVGKTCIVKS
jgi:predicted transglutaminase-like protease